MVQPVSSDPFNVGSFLLTHKDYTKWDILDEFIRSCAQDVFSMCFDGHTIRVTKEEFNVAVRRWIADEMWDSEDIAASQRALAEKVSAVVRQGNIVVPPGFTPDEFVEVLGLAQPGSAVMRSWVITCDEADHLRFHDPSRVLEEDRVASENPLMRNEIMRRILHLVCEAARLGHAKIALQICMDLVECPWVSRILRINATAQPLINEAGRLLMGLVDRCDEISLGLFEAVYYRLQKPDLQFTYYHPIREAVAAALQFYDASMCRSLGRRASPVFAVMTSKTYPQTMLRHLRAIVALSREDQKGIQLIKEDGSGRVVVYSKPLIRQKVGTELEALIFLTHLVDQALERPSDQDTALELLSVLGCLQNLSLKDDRVRIKYEELMRKGTVVINSRLAQIMRDDNVLGALEFLYGLGDIQWVMVGLKLPGAENTRFLELQEQLASRLSTVLKKYNTIVEATQEVNNMRVRFQQVPMIRSLLPQLLQELSRLESNLEEHGEYESRLCQLIRSGRTSSVHLQDWTRGRSASISSHGGSISSSSRGGSLDSLCTSSSFGSRESVVSGSSDKDSPLPLREKVEKFLIEVTPYVTRFRAESDPSIRKQACKKLEKLGFVGSAGDLLLEVSATDCLDTGNLHALYEAVAILEEMFRGGEGVQKIHAKAKDLLDLLYYVLGYVDLTLLVRPPKPPLFVGDCLFLKDVGDRCRSSFRRLCTGVGSLQEDPLRALLWAAATGEVIPDTVWSAVAVKKKSRAGSRWEECAIEVGSTFPNPADRKRLVILACHLGERCRLTTQRSTSSQQVHFSGIEQVLDVSLNPSTDDVTLDAAMTILHNLALFNLLRIPHDEWRNPDTFSSAELAPHLSCVLQVHLAMQYTVHTLVFGGLSSCNAKEVVQRVYRLMQMIERALLRGDYCTAHVLYNVYNGVPVQRIVAPREDMKLGIFKYLNEAENIDCRRMVKLFAQRLDPHQGQSDCTSQTGSLALAAGLRLTAYPENLMRLITGSVGRRGARTPHGRKYVEEVVLAELYSQDPHSYGVENLLLLQDMRFAYVSCMPDKSARDKLDQLFDLKVRLIRESLERTS